MYANQVEKIGRKKSTMKNVNQSIQFNAQYSGVVRVGSKMGSNVSRVVVVVML